MMNDYIPGLPGDIWRQSEKLNIRDLNIQEGFRNENKEDCGSDSCMCGVIFHSRMTDHHY